MENLENIHNIAEPNPAQEEITSATAETTEVAAAPEEPAAPTRQISDDPEVGRLIAEAEQRGYIRGRNEKIEQTVMRVNDGPWNQTADDDYDPCPSFLSHIRPSFWSEF